VFGQLNGIVRLNPNTKSLVPNATTILPLAFTAFALSPSGQLSLSDGLRIKQQVGNSYPTLLNRDLLEYHGSPNAAPSFDRAMPAAISLATDSIGNLYIADRDLHRIRKLVAGSCSGIPGPALQTLLNSFTLRAPNGFSESFAPGELVTIKGSGLGPATGVGPVFDSDSGLAPTTLSGTQVFFDGIPAPILYASDSQINAIVPYTVYGRTASRVSIQYNGVPSDVVLTSLADTDPNVFSPGGSALVINSDGTINSPTNAAKAGSFVVFYMTGLGLTIPNGIDGHIAGTPLPTPLVALTSAPPFTVLYAGSATGLVEGVMQVNLQLPANAQNTGVELRAGVASTAVFVYIR
jgi:uncharacterized protein (TIGR03437 family)